MQAIAALTRLLAEQPEDRDARLALARIQGEAGQPRDQASTLAPLLERDPIDLDAARVAASRLNEDGDPIGALALCKKGLALAPDDPTLLVSHCMAQLALGDWAAAYGRLQEALDQDPDQTIVRHALAEATLNLGDTDVAVALAAEGLRRRPDHLFFIGVIVWAGPIGDFPDVRARLVASAERDGEGVAEAHYMLGEVFDAEGDPARAFRHFTAGNAMKWAQWGGPDYTTLLSRAFTEPFDRAMIQNIGPVGAASDRPVFVVGMPRSGTTVTEQILASHPDGASLGETPMLINTIRDAVGGGGRKVMHPEFWAAAPPALFREIGDLYVDRLSVQAPKGARVVNKLPMNLFLLGVVRLAMPNARIVICRRNPVETCLSCFFQLFDGRPLAATNDLAALGGFYRLHADALEHWAAALGEDTVTWVDNEAFRQDPDGVARSLIADMGLPWNDDCLNFAARKARVRTASALQVRKGPMPPARLKWLTYEPWLGPLLEALGPEIVAESRPEQSSAIVAGRVVVRRTGRRVRASVHEGHGRIHRPGDDVHGEIDRRAHGRRHDASGSSAKEQGETEG